MDILMNTSGNDKNQHLTVDHGGNGKAVNNNTIETLSLNPPSSPPPSAQTNPKVIVLDEWGCYLDMASNKKGDDVINLLARLDLPRLTWFTPAISNINDPAVVVFEKLIPLVREILNRPEFESINSPNHDNTKLESDLKEIIKAEAIPNAMISAIELVDQIESSNELRFPFDFKIVNGDFENIKVWALYNPYLHAFIPKVWTSYAEIKKATAELISKGYIEDESSNRLINGRANINLPHTQTKEVSGSVTIEFKKGVIIKIHSSPCTFIDVEQNIPMKLITHINFHSKMVSLKEIRSLPFDYDNEPTFIYPSLPEKIDEQLIPFVDSRVYNEILETRKLLSSIGKIENKKNEMGDIRVITQWLSNRIERTQDNLNDLIVDNPISISENFPNLCKHFSITQIDEWHDTTSTMIGYRNQGNIYVNEASLCSALLWWQMYNRMPENDAQHFAAEACAALCIKKGSVEIDEIKSLSKKLISQREAYTSMVNAISSFSTGLTRLKMPAGMISAGEARLTLRDLSSARLTLSDLSSSHKHNIKTN